MYPALPRWSAARNGAARPSVPQPTSLTSPPAQLPPSQSGPPPSADSAPPTKAVARGGQVFVNHNATPLPAAAAPAVSHSSRAAPPPPSAVGGRGGGGGVAAAHAPKRRGIVRGSTVANAGELRPETEAALTLGVEGVQTGEEVLIDAAAVRRRSLNSVTAGNNSSGSGSTCPNPQEHGQLVQLRRQLEKSAAAVKAMAAASRREKQDYEARQARDSLQLAECEARLRAVGLLHRGREAAVVQHFSEVLRSAQQALAAAQRGRAEDSSRHDVELALLRQELAAHKASAAAQSAAADTAASHQLEIEKLRAELAALQQSSAAKQLELETALADTQLTLHRRNEELEECRRVQLQCTYLVQQCRLFIRQVCHPGFSVVKGPSLEPVEKDRAEPTGYVLVPLTVMLHAYTLLPEDDRQEVIDHYDKEGRELR